MLIGPCHAEAPYDPLRKLSETVIVSTLLTVDDAERDREIPLRVYRLPETRQAPVVIFSHGLGGSRDGSHFLGEHWAARGYVAVFIQHPGSDESVWRDAPLRDRMNAMRQAASAENLRLRMEDVRVLIDQLEMWSKEAAHPLAGVIDPKQIGMSGHSFGAQTTQAVSGQTFPLIHQKNTDPRIRAAIIMSPGTPPAGSADLAFGKVSIPWLLMTGTHDVSVIGGQTVESRLAVYPALLAGDKFELVLDGAEHSVFTDRALRGDQRTRNPQHHSAILALSTAFWDTYLKQDTAAKVWLTGPGPKSVLTPADRWKAK
ncbi:MAG: dienelactone hydrolase [Planctomycetota bacterium]|nr:MAG: dienelactone hydrolase [Planctomycetota bacterium]